MHLYDDIGDASMSLRGSTYLFYIFLTFELVESKHVAIVEFIAANIFFCYNLVSIYPYLVI